MLLNSKAHFSISLAVVALIVGNCMGIIFISKEKRKTCRFDNRNYTIGQSWHPHLEPYGLNFCIICKCQKNRRTHCERVRCQPLSCPGKKVPQGKCCAVCPVTNTKVSKMQCYHEKKQYNSGQVWEVPVKGHDKTSSNRCAECSCQDGRVSCAVRICPALKCRTIFQEKEKDSCCKRCSGLPLRPEGGTRKPKHTKNLAGSCLSDGIYYKNRDLWNPSSSSSGIKAFQYPDCRLCSCQNANVTCKKVSCPNVTCKNPVRKHAKDCCKSCSDSNSTVVAPIITRSLPGSKKPKGGINPNCNFAGKFYLHNSSWTPQIPGLKASPCVRCACMFSKVSCNRVVCKNGGNCANNCSISKPKPGHRGCSGRRVQVYLLIGASRRAKAKKSNQNSYLAKIALIYTRNPFVEIRHWNADNNKVSLRTSKLRKLRFERRKGRYSRLGETKIRRISRFLDKEKTLARCSRSCKTRAKDLINVLKNRMRYFNKGCRFPGSFKSLKPQAP